MQDLHGDMNRCSLMHLLIWSSKMTGYLPELCYACYSGARMSGSSDPPVLRRDVRRNDAAAELARLGGVKGDI